jgi:hypothetical protein
MSTILILSSERSGSTLLRVLLGQHSRIVAPGELWLMCHPDYASWRLQRPRAMESVLEYFRLIGKPLSAPAIDSRCASLTTPETVRWMLGHLEGGRMMVDKTPAYANDLDFLQRSLELSPFFIWLIRHPLAVIDSHLRLRQARRHQSGFGALLHVVRDHAEELVGRGVRKISRDRENKWVMQHTNIQRFLDRLPARQKAVVHFEDLVATPEHVMSGLCQSLGLDVEPGVTRTPARTNDMPPGLGDPTFGQRNHIDRETAFDWQHRWSGTVLGECTRNLMRQIGVREPAASEDTVAYGTR